MRLQFCQPPLPLGLCICPRRRIGIVSIFCCLIQRSSHAGGRGIAEWMGGQRGFGRDKGLEGAAPYSRQMFGVFQRGLQRMPSGRGMESANCFRRMPPAKLSYAVGMALNDKLQRRCRIQAGPPVEQHLHEAAGRGIERGGHCFLTRGG